MMPSGNKDARELLDFYIEAGADALVGEEPVDRLAAAETAAPPARPRQPAVQPPDLEIKGRASPGYRPVRPR